MQTASSALIVALKASLADAAAAWTVTAASEQTSVQSIVTGSVSGTVAGGEESVSGSVATADKTTVRTSVSLKSGTVPRAAGAADRARLDYVEVKVNGLFTHGELTMDGAQLRSTDTALNTTLAALAAAFLAAKDASATAALASGPQTADALTIPAPLLAALKTSLADAGAEWSVRNRSENVTGEGAARQTDIAVNLGSATVKAAAGSPVPAQFTYMSRRDTFGAFAGATIFMDGAAWRSADAALDSTVLAMAAAWLENQSAALTGGLTAGPV